MNILHLSDFHIDDPVSQEEYLREGFYDEYIESLSKVVLENNISVDVIAITGDIINQGKVSNFEHASKIIKFLAKSFSVSKEYVFLCPGNHDRKRDEKNAVKPLEFDSFTHVLGNQKLIESNDYASLYKVFNSIFLILDSDYILKSKLNDLDSVMGWIKKQAKSANSLVVLSHHPVGPSSPIGPFDDEDSNYHAHHYFSWGDTLKERVCNNAPDLVKIWLSGEVHIPQLNYLDNNLTCITIGRFGTSIKYDSQQRRQAQVIVIDENSIGAELFEYASQTHSSQAQVGNWLKVAHPKGGVRAKPQKVLPVSKEAVQSKQVFLLDEALDKKILKQVKDSNLYQFGKFETSNDSVSLAWVSIGKLLNNRDLCSQFLKKTLEFILEKGSNDCFFIGLDCWGASIASFLSVSSSINCHCIATRSGGKHHDSSEILTDEIVESLDACKEVYLFADVIATGETCTDVANRIKTAYPDVSIIVCSLIADKEIERPELSEVVDNIVVGCNSLRMPILKRSSIPDATIYPPSICLL